MTSDLDIYRTANVLVRQPGEEALTCAASRKKIMMIRTIRTESVMACMVTSARGH